MSHNAFRTESSAPSGTTDIDQRHEASNGHGSAALANVDPERAVEVEFSAGLESGSAGDNRARPRTFRALPVTAVDWLANHLGPLLAGSIDVTIRQDGTPEPVLTLHGPKGHVLDELAEWLATVRQGAIE
ncbi:hypothetical protein [Nocardia sp. NPDC051570]|uniref:hypothetical protein n=1 Tax=Nocardia sp. NPDC051570 TaxID=3364324 RepID=UPI0037A6BFF4